MVSIRKYLSSDVAGDVSPADRKILQLFIDSLGRHAVQAQRKQYERFQQEMLRISRNLTADAMPAHQLVVLGSALHAMEEYNSQTTRFVQQQEQELQRIVLMLTETVLTVGSTHQETSDRLREIEHQIQGCQELDDVKLLRAKLGDCLAMVRTESAHQREKMERAVRTLQSQLDAAKSSVELESVPSPLPVSAEMSEQQAACEQLIRDWVRAPGKRFVAIMVVPRICSSAIR
jgi:hypothetical protein